MHLLPYGGGHTVRTGECSRPAIRGRRIITIRGLREHGISSALPDADIEVSVKEKLST